MAKTPEQTSWYEMKRRKRLNRYKDLDVSICSGLVEFPDFLAVLGLKPTPQHSIDRYPDNLKGYWCGECTECGSLNRTRNVRWATPKEQSRNTRRNHLLTINGETKTVAEWTEGAGLHYLRIIDRLRKGWPVNEDLLSPPRPPRHFVTHDGVTLYLAEWARRLGVDYKFLYQRVRKGMSLEEAITIPNRTTKRQEKQ